MAAGVAFATLPPVALAQLPGGVTPANEREADARAHFERGVERLDHDAWLAELLASRESYPTEKATTNAAICLRRLGRYDEALDQT